MIGTRNGAGESALQMAQARGKRRAYVFLKTLVGEEEDRIRALAHIAAQEGAYPGSSVGIRYHGGEITHTHTHTHRMPFAQRARRAWVRDSRASF